MFLWRRAWFASMRYAQAMKKPKYFVETMQQASDLHINPFALQLLGESFADDPSKFGDENVVFLARAHNGSAVWFIMTKQQPRARDFVDLAEIGTHAAHMSIEQFREWFNRKYCADENGITKHPPENKPF